LWYFGAAPVQGGGAAHEQENEKTFVNQFLQYIHWNNYTEYELEYYKMLLIQIGEINDAEDELEGRDSVLAQAVGAGSYRVRHRNIGNQIAWQAKVRKIIAEFENRCADNHTFEILKASLNTAIMNLFQPKNGGVPDVVDFIIQFQTYLKAFQDFMQFVNDIIRKLISTQGLFALRHYLPNEDQAPRYLENLILTKGATNDKCGAEIKNITDFLATAKCNPENFQITDTVRFMAIDLLLLRPCIEHYMLAVIMGRGGGPEELGATFWGQTELSCYDDSQHGIWGMSYKYHERAIVLNERNLIRVFDVCFDGYCGGNDSSILQWSDDGVQLFKNKLTNISDQYDGPSMIVMALPPAQGGAFPNPLVLQTQQLNAGSIGTMHPDRAMPANNLSKHQYFLVNPDYNVSNMTDQQLQARIFAKYIEYAGLHELANNGAPGHAAYSGETEKPSFSFSGHMASILHGHREETQGSGHLGANFVGVASVREGRGMMPKGMPTLAHLM